MKQIRTHTHTQAPPGTNLSSVKSHRDDKDHHHHGGGEVEGHDGPRPDVPALEDGGVAELDQEDVDGAHGPEQERLDGDGEA